MDYFNSLPLETTLDIFSRVPIESVLECKSVCKNWRSILRHPSFSKMHYLHHHSSNAAEDSGQLSFLAISEDDIFYYFEYNNENRDSKPIQSFRIVNINTPRCYASSFVDSCNGLICLAGGPCVWICNPITRECVALPEIKRDDCNMRIYRYVYWMFGFGYVSSTGEYKIVGIYTAETNFVQVYIYTLGTGMGWRNLGNFEFECDKLWGRHGVFVNGALYWLDIPVGTISTFNLAEEKFCENLSPPPLPPDSARENRIGVLDGVLYFATSLDVNGVECFDIWLLKKKNDNHGKKEGEEHQSLGWSKEFRVQEINVLAVTKNYGVLTFGYGGSYLKIYDTRTSTSKMLVIYKGWLQVYRHKNTLLSLKELGEEDTKTMESIDIIKTGSRDYRFEQLQEDENP